MEEIILHHHLGLGDHFICNGLVRTMKENLKLTRLILPVKEHNLPAIRSLYAEQAGIELMPVPRASYDEEDAYIIAQSKRLEVPILKISYDGSRTAEFDVSFYRQVGLDIDVSWSRFSAPMHNLDAEVLYNKLIQHERYCLVANAGSVGAFDIDVDTKLPIYFVTSGHTDNLLDWSLIISRAHEIHCIDSSVIHLADRLPTRAKRLVYHNVGRGSRFCLKKDWEMKLFMDANKRKEAIGRVFDVHFDALPDEHIFAVDGVGFRVLNPRKSAPLQLRGVVEYLIRNARKKEYGRWRHVCHYSFERLLLEMVSIDHAPRIVETGSSAHGTNSSKLFFGVVDLLGGEFDTVDLNPDATARVQALLEADYPHLVGQVRCHNGDSVDFIRQIHGPIDVAYLDSYDLYPGIFRESELHGLAEFEGIVDKLSETAYVLIDDTPRTRAIFEKMNDVAFMSAVDEHVQIYGYLPGKGALVLKAIMSDPRFTVLYHEYQLLIKFVKGAH